MQKNQEAKKKKKKHYTKPKLEVFGDFAKLTRGTKGGTKAETSKPATRLSGSTA